jgi:hypothetical protein
MILPRPSIVLMAAAVLGSAPPPAVGGTISTAPWGGFTIIIGGGNPPPIYTGSGNTGGDISPATQTKQVGESATFSATGSAPYQWYKDDVAIRGATSSKLQIPKVEAKHAGKYRVSSLFSGGPAATLTVPDQDSTLWSGLVSNWRLTGDGVDDGPFANPLELTDAAPAEDRWGEPGKSIFFNGATTSLVSSFDGGISGRWPRTISFWCRQDYTTAPSRIPLISYGAPNQTFAVWADLSNMSYGFTGITSTRAAALANTLTPNVWQHVVLTVEGDDNGNLVRLYLNGVEQEPQNAFRQAFLTATNGKVHLGADAGGDASAPRFTGWIDDVRLYARVLTAAEIAALHASDTAVPPVIEQQPTPTTVVDPGKPFTLTVTASGTDLTYQWRRGATDIPGATAATYQTDAGPDTAKYTVLVRNAAGAVRSAAAQVYVNQPPSFYVEGPSYVYHGDQVDLRVFAVGTPPLSYQWQRDGVDLPGATATTLSFRATTETSGVPATAHFSSFSRSDHSHAC